MAVVRELITKLGYKVDQQKLNESEKTMKRFGMKTKFAILGAVAGIVGLGKAAISASADMETLLTTFEVMLGSTEAAQKMMDEMRQFSLVTPFETEDLARAGTTLLQFGIAEERVLPTLRMLGDVAGSNREKFNSLALVFGQIQSTGRLMGQDLLQLINQGFNPLQVISEQTGKSVAQLKDEMSKGMISADMVTEAFKVATSEGGMFFENMKKQSTTLTGLFSTMRGAFKEVLIDVGNVLMPAVKDITKLLIELAQTTLKDIAVALGEVLLPLVELVTTILQPLLGALIPLFKAMAGIMKPFIEILETILAPILEFLVPLIGFVAKIFDWWGKILQALLPFFDMLSNVLMAFFEIFEGIFAILTPIIDVFVAALAPLIKIITLIVKVALAPLIAILMIFGRILQMIGAILAKLFAIFKPIFDVIERFVDVFQNLFDEVFMNLMAALQGLFDVLAPLLVPVLEWILKWVIQFVELVTWALTEVIKGIEWLINKVKEAWTWLLDLLGIDEKKKPSEVRLKLEPPDPSKNIKAGMGGAPAINMQANVNVKAKGNINDPRAAQAMMEQSARAAFTLELQKILINAGI
jgi:tape measure domain-containing protein